MNVGTLDVLVNRRPGDDRPLQELYSEALDTVVASEEVGFDFALCGEHHFMESQWNPSPLLLLAALSQRTSRIRLGTNVLLAPLYNPLRLSEDIATLDLLSNGRIDITFGSGSIAAEFDTFGIDKAERFGRLWETLGIVRRSFAEEEFDHSGKYFRFDGVRQTTKPVQDPVPLWFSGLGPKMLERAGREGCHLIAMPGGPMERYYEGLSAGGHDVSDVNIGFVGQGIHVVATAAEVPDAREKAFAEADARRREYHEESPYMAAGAVEVNDPVVGTPDQVLEQLEPEMKDSDLTHLIVYGSREELALIGREMIPTLHTWGRQPVTAS